MRTLVALIAALPLFLSCLTTQARELRFAEASSGLAFSAEEVDHHSESARALFMRDMEREGRLGCVLRCAMIDEVWARLRPVIAYQFPDSASPMQLLVVTSDAVSARSFPNGTLIISESFIARMQLGQDELAFVLAHEASHVLLQHERQTLTSFLAIMPSNAKRTPRDLYVDLEFRYFSISDSVSLVLHQIEFEADEVGLQIAALAGFKPDAQLKFMEKLSRGETPQTMLSMHPSATLRLAGLRESLPLARRLFDAGRE